VALAFGFIRAFSRVVAHGDVVFALYEKLEKSRKIF
jgi:hypothetical protein